MGYRIFWFGVNVYEIDMTIHHRTNKSKNEERESAQKKCANNLKIKWNNIFVGISLYSFTQFVCVCI